MNLETAVKKGCASGVPATFTVPLPHVGGYRLKDLRRLCHQFGAVRFEPHTDEGQLTGLTAHVFGQDVEPPLIALDMLVRDDVVGLERAIISAIDQVDEIVVVVDGRSCPETHKIAEAYADTVVVFEAEDIKLSQEEWDNDRIHFARARNLGRERVQAPWTLVLDADEFLKCDNDFRDFVRKLDIGVGGVNISIGTADFFHRDAQRLARTQFRFFSSMHNQLPITGIEAEAPLSVFIRHDISLRSEIELQRRKKQRDEGIEQLVKEGRKGDLSALFHAAKHYIGNRDDRGVSLIEYYRLRTEIHGPLAAERVWLALSAAAIYHERGDLRQAEIWAIRALVDGPRIEAFTMLGDIAEDDGDLNRARRWYECACAIEPETAKFSITEIIDQRVTRRDGLRITLMRPPDAPALKSTDVAVES